MDIRVQNNKDFIFLIIRYNVTCCSQITSLLIDWTPVTRKRLKLRTSPPPNSVSLNLWKVLCFHKIENTSKNAFFCGDFTNRDWFSFILSSQPIPLILPIEKLHCHCVYKLSSSFPMKSPWDHVSCYNNNSYMCYFKLFSIGINSNSFDFCLPPM